MCEVDAVVVGVVPHLRFGQAAKSVGCRKPAEFIQDPSPQKKAEDLSPEERASPPGCPLRSGDRKRAGFYVELMVSYDQQTVHKLSGAVHYAIHPIIEQSCTFSGRIRDSGLRRLYNRAAIQAGRTG